jgi:hypothetical protein
MGCLPFPSLGCSVLFLGTGRAFVTRSCRFGCSKHIANLLYLVAGIFLALFSLKFLVGNLLGGVSKERLFAYFLLLWGGASFFFGVDDIIYFTPLLSQDAEPAVALIAELFYLFSGVLLTLFGFRLLQSKES